jgi:hypothetical protein
MNPRESDGARVWSERLDDSIHEQGLGYTLSILVEGDLTNRRGGALRGSTERFVCRIVVVRGRQQLLSRRDVQPGVQQPQPHGGAVGQRDLVGLAAEVLSGGFSRFSLQPRIVLWKVGRRTSIQLSAVLFDGVSHVARMRRNQQCAEVNVVTGELKLLPHVGPRTFR